MSPFGQDNYAVAIVGSNRGIPPRMSGTAGRRNGVSPPPIYPARQGVCGRHERATVSLGGIRDAFVLTWGSSAIHRGAASTDSSMLRSREPAEMKPASVNTMRCAWRNRGCITAGNVFSHATTVSAIRSTTAGSPRPPPHGPGYGHAWRPNMRWKLAAQFQYTIWTGVRTNPQMESAVQDKTPFFIWSGYHHPRSPYCVPEPWASLCASNDMDGQVRQLVTGEFDLMPPPHPMTRDPNAALGPFNEDGRPRHGYHPHRIKGVTLARQHLHEAAAVCSGAISLMDKTIGSPLDTLGRPHQRTHTLIVCPSGHARFLYRHVLITKGPFHYGDLLRVPMTVAWPGRIPADAPTLSRQTLVDYAPTFLEASGVSVPPWMQGRSRLVDWSGKHVTVRRRALIVKHHHSGAAVHLRTWSMGRYKLTLYRGRFTWGELFDLQTGPEELPNQSDVLTSAAPRFNAADDRCGPRACADSAPTYRQRLPRKMAHRMRPTKWRQCPRLAWRVRRYR